MTVNMTVPIAKAQDALSVPIAAIFKGEGNSKVVYVRSGETTQKRQVTVGVTNFDYVQILKGLDEGEQILLVEPSRRRGQEVLSRAGRFSAPPRRPSPPARCR